MPLTPEEIQAAIDAALNGTGAPVAPKPGVTAAPPPLPPGYVPSPTAGRGISTDGFNAVQLNPQTNQWQVVTGGFAPSAAERAAAGVNRGTTTSGGTTTNYAVQNASQKDAVQQAGGAGKALPAGFYYTDSTQTRATNGFTVATKDPTTLNWVNAGYSPTKTDIAGARMTAAAAMRNGGTAPTAPTTTTTGATTGNANLFAALPLEARSGSVIPTVFGQNAADFRLNGPISSEGRQTLRSNDLNTLYTGRQGSAVQIPVTPGFRGEGQVGNNINFGTGSTGGGRAEPQMLFGPTIASVPDTYVYGQGNVNAGNQAYQTYANIGAGGALPINIAGNNVQLQSADKGTGFGFALNAPIASNVFAAASRGSSDDPALQAVQALQLQAAIDQYGMGAVTAANPNQFGGNHAGTMNGPWSGNGGMGQGVFFSSYDPERDGFGLGSGDIYGGGFGVDGGQRGFAGGGRIVVRPLGGPVTNGPKQMVTNGPKVLVDVRTGRVDAIMGEDNRDPDRVPDRELLRLSGPMNSRLDIKPLEPFAEGGYIQTVKPPVGGVPDEGEGYYTPPVTTAPTPAPAPPTYETEGYYGGTPGPTESSYQTPTAPTAPTPAPAPFEMPPPPVGYTPPPPVASPPPTTLPPGEITIDPGGMSAPVVDPNAGFDVYDAANLAPWERALRELTLRDAARNAYSYRNKFAGLQGPVAVPVLQGDVPQTELPPGMYYDPSGQINRTINNIISATENYRSLGPEENITPVYEQVSQIGKNLDNWQKIQDLTLQRTGVAASSGAGSTEAAQRAAAAAEEAAQAYAVLHLTQQGLEAVLGQAGGNTRDPNYVEYVNALNAANAAYTAANNRALALQREASFTGNESYDQRLAAIDAQMAELQASLPEGFSEAADRTTLARLQQRVNLQDKRVLHKGEVANLAKLGVPKLNGPILSVAA